MKDSNKKGVLYLIPNLLGNTDAKNFIPDSVFSIVPAIKDFITENEKTARRYLKKIHPDIFIDEIRFYLLNEHTKNRNREDFILPLLDGKDMGMISDAGCPAIADPGADVVRLAHAKGITVIPLVGPSSIFLSLMASGLNGQNFVFHGYLPTDQTLRRRKLAELEKFSRIKKQTQMIIETPYRNEQLFNDILTALSPGSDLCVAADLTLPDGWIYTKTIAEWRRFEKPDLRKRPAVFLFLSGR